MSKQLPPVVIHNKELLPLIKNRYSLDDLNHLFSLLKDRQCFDFPALGNGLFPAASLVDESQYTGYGKVWVRDNIYVALSHYLNGQSEIAQRNVTTLAAYFIKHKWRLADIVDGKLDYNYPMNRPHIRFNGEDLSESDQRWAHAENDALGYFLWLFCKIHNESGMVLREDEKELIILLVSYFGTIRYWQDEDSGHWEEGRKIEASSIGVVLAALSELHKLLQEQGLSSVTYTDRSISTALVQKLIDRGRQALNDILPSESIQEDSNKNRRFDAALLFLIFPMTVVSEAMADQIVNDVVHNLQGTYGIRRYLGDSFWSADYKKKLKPEERTIDVSDDISRRDSLHQEGREAQWCIFDPILSIIYGLKYQRHKQPGHLVLQTHYFNRALGQVTGDDCPFGAFRCPELFYLEDEQYVPNDTVPLLWTQANLWLAFTFMKRSLVPEGPNQEQ